MIVHRPRTFEEALREKARDAHAVPVAGGTDLWVEWPSNLAGRERTYVDLNGLAEIRELEFNDDCLVIGAGATYWDVLTNARCAEEFPILLDAARQVGAVQIQTRGTWAGNIANASPAADGVPVLMALDATVVLASVRGERRVALDRFYLDYKKTVAEPDELIRAVRVPRRSSIVGRFEKVGSRRAQTIAKVGVAVTSSEAGWRVVAISMAPTTCRCHGLEELLGSGRPIATPDDLFGAIDQDLSPIDDLRSTAAYRRMVFARVVFALIDEQRNGKLP